MKGKAITAALIGAAVALGDSVRDVVTPDKPRKDLGRKRWSRHSTFMGRARGVRLNLLKLSSLPATPGKINRRRSDPLHDQHHRYCGLADPCTSKHTETERVQRHQVPA